MAKIIPNENTFIGFAATLTGTIAAPKVADVTGATDVTGFVMSLNASSQGNIVPTPSLDTLFETNIPGTSQASFSGDFYRDDTNDAAWDLWTRGDSGFFIITRYGGIPSTVGDVCEVWPVRIVSKAMANMANNTVETFTLTCSVPVEPDEAAVVVA
jgi:hypothetical protein